MQLLFIGDSLTSGVSDSERLGWAGRICKQLDPQGAKLTAYNLGVRASTTAHIESRWEKEAADRINPEAPVLLIFCMGAPDAVKDIPFGQSKVCAESILHNAKSNYATVFITPPPMIDEEKDKRTENLSAEFIKICSKLDIPCLDINSPLRENPAYIKALKESDGVHPNAEGYGIMAGVISKFISPYILPHLS
ncbi:GDSL-type esterase/lipase family protein [Maridesulfovibrio salexigens]|uniref:Lipolytic protein G-D-S-L family n=1 Tax=Maridesulfovibrio salexigens (strain ATCC 14822 / DSM 2638 / NCIMB 8403 / VKM B-1763) TaxID=526222 RepID=C6C0K9_MARSD|nr:GDSL-type esterase/lipase family protein [Maridesulfovibrio salexigens]ACS79143.1 lipolytic protein G-D-S-L family [Maridesulfovibrio salexigens DSM 2638]